jgi:hypothetical protein
MELVFVDGLLSHRISCVPLILLFCFVAVPLFRLFIVTSCYMFHCVYMIMRLVSLIVGDLLCAQVNEDEENAFPLA